MHVSRTPDEQERTIAESGKIESERFPAPLFRVTDTAARQAAGLCRLTGELFRGTGRWIARGFSRLYRSVKRLLERTVFVYARNFGNACKGFGLEMQEVAESTAKAKQEHGLLTAIPVFALLFGKRAVKHRRIFTTVINYALPIFACAVLLASLQFWSGQTFALRVDYNGETLGYINDESVFEEASDRVASLLLSSNDASAYVSIPSYTLSIVKPAKIIDADVLCDKMVQSSGEMIENGCGVYIDNRFVGALKNESDARGLFDEILKSFQTENSDAEVSFSNDISLKLGFYPTESIVDVNQMTDTVMGLRSNYTLRAENTSSQLLADKLSACVSLINSSDDTNETAPSPLLDICVTKTETYTEPIGYTSEQINDNSKYNGYKKLRRQGQNGQSLVTCSVSYVNGEEVGREIVSRETTVEPVSEQIVVGTKIPQKTSSQGDGVRSGKFIWPVNGGYISSPFGGSRSHRGIDIAAPYGTDIYASDSGTVELVQNYVASTYGYQIVINHGDGFKTRYAHCSAIFVTPGQKVTKGQIIGAVGSTGRSTGNHCHFEVIRNGSLVNPASYVSK